MTEERGFSLVEVIISIAVLSILCGFFLQLFIKANDIGQKTEQYDQAIAQVNSTIEVIAKVGLAQEELERYYPTIEQIQPNQFQYALNQQFTPIRPAEDKPTEPKKYRVEIKATEKESIKHTLIQFYQIEVGISKSDGQQIYSLTVDKVIDKKEDE